MLQCCFRYDEIYYLVVWSVAGVSEFFCKESEHKYFQLCGAYTSALVAHKQAKIRHKHVSAVAVFQPNSIKRQQAGCGPQAIVCSMETRLHSAHWPRRTDPAVHTDGTSAWCCTHWGHNLVTLNSFPSLTTYLPQVLNSCQIRLRGLGMLSSHDSLPGHCSGGAESASEREAHTQLPHRNTALCICPTDNKIHLKVL